MTSSWIEEYQTWINTTLPELAAQNPQLYPVRFNHCWARILLDNYFRGFWKQYLSPPAYKNLTEEQAKVICKMASLIPLNPDLAHFWNVESLKFRGKYND